MSDIIHTSGYISEPDDLEPTQGSRTTRRQLCPWCDEAIDIETRIEIKNYPDKAETSTTAHITVIQGIGDDRAVVENGTLVVYHECNDARALKQYTSQLLDAPDVGTPPWIERIHNEGLPTASVAALESLGQMLRDHTQHADDNHD